MEVPGKVPRNVGDFFPEIVIRRSAKKNFEKTDCWRRAKSIKYNTVHIEEDVLYKWILIIGRLLS